MIEKQATKTGLIVVIAVLLLSAPATAQTTPQEEQDEDTLIDLSGITEAIDDLAESFEQFTGSWDETLEEILISVLFEPFKFLAQQLLEILSLVLLHTPDIHPNPAVEDVHSHVLLVTYLLSGIAFMTAGLLYITGPLFGISYTQVRMILPRILAALIFSTISLPLLQYALELSNALIHAFAPTQLSMSLTQLAGLSAGLVLAWVVNSTLLLAVIVMFIIRNVYIMFVAAISPLLALTWSIPRAKRYADTFIAGWWTALAMAPLDMLVLKFSFALLKGNGAGIPASISNWILGVASFTLLILVPYQLYGASQAAVGQAYSISQGFKNRAKQAYRLKRGKDMDDNRYRLSQDEMSRVMSYRQRKYKKAEKFRANWTPDSGGKSDD